ncbi:MAG: hypothetical protein Q7S40_32190 [Opitutaceae bacterium]|nr:hypothetical protein [Opitutaceae bacterium]
MQLTQESRRTWWAVMLASWGVATLLILLHTGGVREYVDLLDGLGRRGGAAPETPMRQVIPARHADAQMWVRHALDARERGELRVRHTTADNAPLGREVHWSSAFSWVLRAAAALQRAMTGQSPGIALERTLLWFNAPLLIALMILMSTWVARRAGAGAGMMIAFAMVGQPRFYEGFAPTYVDHHGMVNAAILALLLGAGFMGMGWWRPSSGAGVQLLPASLERARGAAVFSALAGAFGMWLSAAATIPIIALIGTAGLVLVLVQGRAAGADGLRFEPQIWRIWGRTGAAASLVFYLCEYAPANFGLRLEVNHPFYSFAWWGGAEIVAALSAWWLAGVAAGGTNARRSPLVSLLRRLWLPMVAVATVPVAIVAGGRATFLVSDPFVGALRHFVAEGRSLPAVIRQFGFRPVAADLGSVTVLLVAAFFLRRNGRDIRIIVGGLGGVTAALMAMAGFEMRWWLAAGAAQVVLMLPLVGLLPAAGPRGRWGWTLAVASLVFAWPAVHRVVTTRAENRRHAVAEGDLLPPLYRDIAATVRATQPEGDIILLASPNASAGISYYGGFKTVGTLFWENAPGLRAAAEILSAPAEQQARTMVAARGITHVVLISTANFLGEYFQLLHPDTDLAAAKKSFGFRLAAREIAPAWLQPIPYRGAPELRPAAASVQLFKVVPAQDEGERLYHAAIAAVADDQPDVGEKLMHEALARSPAENRRLLCESAGAAFYDFGADAAAVRLFRLGLEHGYDPAIAGTLAWILATSSDAALRDGRAALALVEESARQQQTDPMLLSALAAAYAEVGRFAEAAKAAERALALARAARDEAAEPLLERRLNAYRRGQPWRQ